MRWLSALRRDAPKGSWRMRHRYRFGCRFTRRNGGGGHSCWTAIDVWWIIYNLNDIAGIGHSHRLPLWYTLESSVYDQGPVSAHKRQPQWRRFGDSTMDVWETSHTRASMYIRSYIVYASLPIPDHQASNGFSWYQGTPVENFGIEFINESFQNNIRVHQHQTVMKLSLHSTSLIDAFVMVPSEVCVKKSELVSLFCLSVDLRTDHQVRYFLTDDQQHEAD